MCLRRVRGRIKNRGAANTLVSLIENGWLWSQVGSIHLPAPFLFGTCILCVHFFLLTERSHPMAPYGALFSDLGSWGLHVGARSCAASWPSRSAAAKCSAPRRCNVLLFWLRKGGGLGVGGGGWGACF